MSGGDTSRSLSSAVKTQLASNAFNMAHLVKLELNTTYYLTDNPVNVVDGSDTYSPNGFLQGVSEVVENSSIDIGSISIQISNANQTIFSDVLTNGHLHRQVTIKRAILDTASAIVGTFTIYSGFIESMGMSEGGQNSMISFGVANHWADFQRIEGRRTNNNSQQQHYTGDKGFEFASQTDKKLFWGNTDMADDDWYPVVQDDPIDVTDDTQPDMSDADVQHASYVAFIQRMEATTDFVWNGSSQQQQYWLDTGIWFETTKGTITGNPNN